MKSGPASRGSSRGEAPSLRTSKPQHRCPNTRTSVRVVSCWSSGNRPGRDRESLLEVWFSMGSAFFSSLTFSLSKAVDLQVQCSVCWLTKLHSREDLTHCLRNYCVCKWSHVNTGNKNSSCIDLKQTPCYLNMFSSGTAEASQTLLLIYWLRLGYSFFLMQKKKSEGKKNTLTERSSHPKCLRNFFVKKNFSIATGSGVAFLNNPFSSTPSRCPDVLVSLLYRCCLL